MSVSELARSFKEYCRLFAVKWYAIVIGIVFGVFGIILDIARWDGMSTRTWLTGLLAGSIAATFCVFHEVRRERDELRSKLAEVRNGPQAKLARAKARLRELGEDGLNRWWAQTNKHLKTAQHSFAPIQANDTSQQEWRVFEEWQCEVAAEIEELLGSPARGSFMRCWHGKLAHNTYHGPQGASEWFDFHSKYLHARADSLDVSDVVLT